MRMILISLLLGVLVGQADAAPEVERVAAAAAADPAARRHTVYVEAFGKGGFWALGYEHRLSPRLAAGAAASAAWIGDERFLSLSPYVAAELVRRGRHAWFAQLGPQLVHHAVISPVPEWDGVRHLGTAGQLSSGWELRAGPRLVVRVSLSVIAGQGGIVPWGGLAAGVRL